MAMTRRNALLLLIGWIIAMAIVLPFDRATAVWVQHHLPLIRHPTLIQVMRVPGRYPYLIPVGILVGLLYRNRWRAAAPLLLTGPPVGLLYTVMKWCFGRRRPVIEIAPFRFHPFIDGIRGLFVSVPGLSFPSGDAMMASATATVVTIILPRWAALAWAWALITCVERVLENAHYLSDVVSGTTGGVLCGWFACWLAIKLLGKHPDEAPADQLLTATPRT